MSVELLGRCMTSGTISSDDIVSAEITITSDRCDWSFSGVTVFGAGAIDKMEYKKTIDAVYIGEDKMTDKRIREARNIYQGFIEEVVTELIEEIAKTSEHKEIVMGEYSRYEKEIRVEFVTTIKDERLDKLYAAEEVAYDLLREWEAAASLISESNDIPIFDIRGAIKLIKNYNV